MFTSLLVCLFVIIVMTIAICIICAPFSIEIRMNTKKAICFQFGNCMPDVWLHRYWFSIFSFYFDDEDNIEQIITIWKFWMIENILYINGEDTPTIHQEDLHIDEGKIFEEAEVVDEELEDQWDALVRRAREKRERDYYDEQL